MVKEYFEAIRVAFRTTRKNRGIFFWVFLGLLAVVFGGFMGLAAATGSATAQDANGTKVTHENCLLNEKHENSYIINRMINYEYSVKTSCGDFDSTSSINAGLSEGSTYTFTTSEGNWATKPQLISALPSK